MVVRFSKLAVGILFDPTASMKLREPLKSISVATIFTMLSAFGYFDTAYGASACKDIFTSTSGSGGLKWDQKSQKASLMVQRQMAGMMGPFGSSI